MDQTSLAEQDQVPVDPERQAAYFKEQRQKLRELAETLFDKSKDKVFFDYLNRLLGTDGVELSGKGRQIIEHFISGKDSLVAVRRERTRTNRDPIVELTV